MNIGKTLGYFIASCCCLTALLFGQAADGNLVGNIYDRSGAALAGAAVTLENVDTGVKYSATTNSEGLYRFNNVPAGAYRFTAAQTGFTTSTAQNLRIESNRTTTFNATLEVGAVATTVEVQEASVLIDTTTANITNTYGTRVAQSMPITGFGTGSTNLGVINLSLLSSGVTSSGGVGYGTGPSVGGQRPTNNNFMVEGIDNNNRSTTGPSTTIPNEAVAEFSLQQNQFSAEFGHSSGGQFNTILKSGGNEIHGSLYEYNQNKLLAAIDESFARQGIRKAPRYDNNRLGGTVGGPIIKNKWFYFGNVEYNPLGQASTSAGATLAPTAAGISTLESTPGVSRRNLDVFKQYVPVAASATSSVTVAGRQIPVGLIQAIGPAFSNFWTYLFTSDYNFSERDQLRARYVYNKQDQTETRVSLPAFYTPIKLSWHMATLTHLHTFSPTITNELRLGYQRRMDNRPTGDQQFPGLDSFPNLQFNDLSLGIGPLSSYPQSNRNNTFQLVNNVNWSAGRHTWKFGYDGRKLNISNFFVQRNRGEYIYNTLDRYLQDITPEFGQRSVGGFPFIGNLLSHYAFVNDEWRVRPNVTLTLGLRYEFIDVPVGAKQQSLNSISSVPGLLEFNSPRPTKKDFAPRIGIAWSPGTSGKTSIRAGFGMVYDQVYQNLGNNSLPPQFFTTLDAHVDVPNQPNFLGGGAILGGARPITNVATARRLTSSYIPDQTRPYSVNWNFGIQQVLQEDYTLEVRYLGTRGVHLPFQVQLNRPAGVTAERNLPLFFQQPSQAEIDARPLTLSGIPLGLNNDPYVQAGFTTAITTFLPQGNSSYHGLATQLTRRYSNGLQFTGAYTWSHNIDDSTAALNSTVLTPRRPQDFNNLRPERASSALDRRHRFTFGWLYDTPWYRGSNNWFMKNLVGNWVFAGVYTAETGAWATARSAADSNRNGDNAGDRTVINLNGDPAKGSGVTPLCKTGTGPCTVQAAANRIVGYLVNDPTAGYIVAGEGVMPTAGRNTIRLPGINNFDLTLGKKFNFTERIFMELRGEFYNALNHAQFTAGVPNAANLRTRNGATETALLIPGNAIFQRPDLAFQSNARQGQLVLRLQF